MADPLRHRPAAWHDPLARSPQPKMSGWDTGVPALFVRVHGVTWVIALIVLLWPLEIGPEVLAELPPEVQSTPAPSPPPTRAAGVAKARSTLPAFDTQKDDPIDREAFIASFRRQARQGALPCLLQWRPSPASLHLAATLLKSGQLKNLHAIAADANLPDCLEPAVAKMSFAPLAAPLKADAQELQWRIDW